MSAADNADLDPALFVPFWGSLYEIIGGVRKAERERIATAIETYLDSSDCDNDPTCELCGLVRHAAAIARAEPETTSESGTPCPNKHPHDSHRWRYQWGGNPVGQGFSCPGVSDIARAEPETTP